MRRRVRRKGRKELKEKDKSAKERSEGKLSILWKGQRRTEDETQKGEKTYIGKTIRRV